MMKISGIKAALTARAKSVKRDIPAVYLALRDRRTPVPARIMAWLTVAYALSPVDLIPDFIPVLGYLDDVLLLPAMAALTIRLIPEDVMSECRGQAEQMWLNGRPKKLVYGIPIIVFWAVIAWVIIRSVFF